MKLSINKLSELTGIDRRRVKRCVADLIHTVKGRAHLYDSVDALPALYLIPGNDEPLDLTQERARLAHYQANKVDLELKVMRGDLIALDEVGDVVGEDYANVRAKLLSLPSKMTPELQDQDFEGMRTVIEKFIYEALEELCADEEYEQEN